MTYSFKNFSNLTDKEWNEMIAIKNAIDYDISQVHPKKMEEFTEYFVRTIREKGG